MTFRNFSNRTEVFAALNARPEADPSKALSVDDQIRFSLKAGWSLKTEIKMEGLGSKNTRNKNSCFS